ncbi:MAG: TRAP transporter large permease subunit [Aquincola sp.]|nr:TRAP transporter large permease subunit [Aquincola sp.]
MLGLTNPELGVLMLGLFVAFIMLGFPIAFTLMALGIGFGYLAMGDTVFQLVVQRTYSVMANDVLISIPLFLFMGYIIERANILDRLFNAIRAGAGLDRPGSLAIATLATCAIFATGIVGAVVTLMDLLAFPAVYVGVLFLEWFLNTFRGLFTPAGARVRVIDYSVPNLVGYLIAAGAASGAVMLMLLGRKVFMALATSFFPLTLLIMSVLGAIFFGIATPTEAAAIGTMGSLLLAAAYRSLSFTKLKESVFLTGRTSAMVCWLFVGSFIFSSIFAYLGGHEPIRTLVAWVDPSPTVFLILTQVIIFILGWPLEWTEIIVIFVPIFLPLLQQFNVDPVFFGILIALNIQTSFLSPPVAMAPFYLKGVAPKHVSINEIFAGVMPFLWIVLLAMITVYIFPQIILWLPNYLY